MRKQKLLLSLLFFFFAGNLLSQNNFAASFPLKVGNKFIYKTHIVAFPNFNSVSYSKSYISKDTIINSRKYFFIDSYGGRSNSWWRFDSTSGNLFTYDPTNSCPVYYGQKIVDSLFAGINDTTKGCGSDNLYCKDTLTQNIFNAFVFSKSFYKYVFLGFGYYDVTRIYTAEFGIIRESSNSHGGGGTGSSTTTLIGCVINGVLYGDTSTTSVTTISSVIPERFSLSQNYPNPFNPSTKINYEIKSVGFVSLKVFDLLGKEVAALVNEKQNAGSYAVDFNSMEFSLPSGIYFYNLNAGEFKETKKMILVK